MSIAHDYHLASVHVHMNLLGWVSLAVVGIIYTLHQQAATTRLAKFHFWLHNLSLPFMMVGLGFVLYGKTAWVPLVSVSATILVISILLFAINILSNLKTNP
jgi:cbb3-type cytochrome oxidase subunit 1